MNMTFVRLLDMGLVAPAALGLEHAHDQEHQGQKVAIVVAAPVRAQEHPLHVDHGTFDHVALVRDQEGAGG
ncbi:MAG: hypothetical protein U1E17_06255 [Geminicoccaceae bacterium]